MSKSGKNKTDLTNECGGSVNTGCKAERGDNAAVRERTPLRDWLIIAAIGAVISLLVMWGRGAFSAQTAQETMRYISDGFFVAGVVLAGMAGLAYCGNEGTFDMLFFGIKQLVRSFTVRDMTQRKESFYDYRKKKQAAKKPVLYILITGGCFILAGGLFLGLFYAV